MKNKIALITGITGQDGSYLARLLLKKGYKVHGIKRRSSLINTSRVDDIYEEPFKIKKKFFMHYGDLTDSSSLHSLILKIMPDEIYNLAAQSHVAVSFEMPEYTSNVNALGTLRILEIVKHLRAKKKIKFYQASSSELYGKTSSKSQNEKTPFYPISPYAVSKLFAHWITINYREAYGIFAVNGILFNHESPVRGETFVTKKIVRGLVKIKLGLQKILYLGNLDSKRDWGHAEDYVEMQWRMLQNKIPEDFVIATGQQYSVREFIVMVAKELSLTILWKGKKLNEVGVNEKNNIIIKVSKKYYRPHDVTYLKGDSKYAKKKLGWKLKHNINSLVKDMVDAELKNYSEKNIEKEY